MKQAGRRKFLTTGTSLALAGMAMPSLAADNSCDGGMSRADYERYLDLFNKNDKRFLEYYHDEVVLELGDSTINGANGIWEFYAPVKEHIKETVICTTFVGDANGIAVEIPTVFECIKNWEDSFWGTDLIVGQVLEITSWAFYAIEDGKFKHIRTARAGGTGEWVMKG